MRSLGEAVVFGALSVAAHVAVVAGLAGPGPEMRAVPETAALTGVATGTATVQATSVAVPDPAVEALLTRWSGPTVAAGPTPVTPPPAVDAAAPLVRAVDRPAVAAPPAGAGAVTAMPLSPGLPAPVALRPARAPMPRPAFALVADERPRADPPVPSPPPTGARQPPPAADGMAGVPQMQTRIARSDLARWGAAIRDRIDRVKRTPAGGWAPGTAVVRITVRGDGALAEARLLRSAGDGRLDGEALRAVRQAAPYRPGPLPTSASEDFDLPISFLR